MKKLVIGILILVLLVVGAGLLFREQIGERLFSRAVETAVTRDVIGDLPDGINVVLCGSGSPLPDPTRAGPCSAVIIDGKMFIVDIGGGAVRNLGLMGLNPGVIEALLLTHFHSDHIDGMGELMMQRWAGGGRDAPLPVIAPEGVTAIVDGLNAAYAADAQYRIAHHGAATILPTGTGGEARPFSIPDGQEEMVVYEQDGIKITAFPVNHKPIAPAVGYRFDYKGRSVVFSGDTIKLPSIAKACNGCDLLIHEALNAEMVRTMEKAFAKAGRKRLAKIMADIQNYHTTPVEAAETAKAGKAKMLVLSHIVPALPLDYLEAYYMKGVDAAFDGPAVLGKDGMLFSLPANKDSIERGDLR
jgi:ribonuclease Z